MFKLVGSHFGKLLKVDEFTENSLRIKFARIYVEIDLTQSLKKGLWIGSQEECVMMAVLPKNLPMFCYKYGRVGHEEAAYTLETNNHLDGEARHGSLTPGAYILAKYAM